MFQEERKNPFLPAAAIGGAALAGLTWARYRREIGKQRRRVSKGSQIAETASGPIEYAETGSGAPLLAIHGAGGGYDQGLLIAGPLAEKGFRVVAMSRFGYLRTPLPADASPQAQADAHAHLLDALGISRAVILGASAGGPSAMQFAIRHPERTAALVLVVPLAWSPKAEAAAPIRMPAGARFLFEAALESDFLFWAAMRLAPSVVTRSILGTPPEVLKAAEPAEKARIARMMREILPVTARRAGLRNEAAIASSLERYDLERITAPALAISLEDDLYGTYDGARYTAENVPDGRFVGYPSGGHLAVGHNEEMLAEIAGFLDAHTALIPAAVPESSSASVS